MNKTVILLSVMVLLGLNINLFAQLEVQSNNSVWVGPTWGGTTPYTFKTNGTACFTCYPASSSIYFENYATTQPAIVPQWANAAYLGRSDRQFFKVYSHYIYMNGALVLTSDEKVKENIKPLTGSMNKLRMIKPYKYDIKASFYEGTPDQTKNKLRPKDNMGFLAQDLQKVYPELVYKDDDSGLLGINYVGMVPILVEAMQEQQKQIDELKAEIELLKKMVEKLAKKQ